MNSQIADISPYPALRPRIERGAVLCGLWLRVAFIGASAFALGIMQLFGGGMEWLPALALTVVSGMLTAFAMRRARGALDADDDAASSPAVGAGSPRRALAI